VEMNYLVDTNVFLEILLGQQKNAVCKDFLRSNTGKLFLSDFSLHSIGVILFKNNREDIFNSFALDVLDHISIVSLPKKSYKNLADLRERVSLDFDDSYQFAVAREYGLSIVTMDGDFKKVRNEIDVVFL
jgi:predicted nucleic acid-binding protein